MASEIEDIIVEPLTAAEKQEFTGVSIGVIKSSLDRDFQKSYTYWVFTDVEKALKSAGDNSYVTGNLECVYNLSEDRLIHIEHPEMGITPALQTTIEYVKREAFEQFKRAIILEKNAQPQ